MRIDDCALYNPFGWRLAEIADPATDDARCRELAESLVICEAEELALGRRHLTIVHGNPDFTVIIAERKAQRDELAACEPQFVFNGAPDFPQGWTRRDAILYDQLGSGETIQGIPGCLGVAEGVAGN